MVKPFKNINFFERIAGFLCAKEKNERFTQKTQAICSFVLSKLSESHTLAHLS